MKKITILFLLFVAFVINPLNSFALNKIPEGDGVNLLPNAVSAKNIKYIKDIGFDFVRTGLPWGLIEKEKGIYVWKSYDHLINSLLTNNLKPIIIIGFNNSLYGGAHTFTGISTAEQREGLAKFAAALVSRYKDKGIVWEIWNEPNIGEFWKPSPNYTDYSKMANCVVDEIRKIAPNEVIIAPGIAIPNSGEFLKIIGKSNLFNKIDAISFHFYPYGTYSNQYPEKLNIAFYIKMIQSIVKANISTKIALPIVSSEAGWSTVWWSPMNEQAQLLCLTRQIVLNKANGIKLSIWHNLKDAGYSATDPEANFGLVRHDGSLKPSYNAVKDMIQQLKGKSFVRAVKLASKDDFAYVFTDGKNEYLFAWTIGSKHNITIKNRTFSLNKDVLIALLK